MRDALQIVSGTTPERGPVVRSGRRMRARIRDG